MIKYSFLISKDWMKMAFSFLSSTSVLIFNVENLFSFSPLVSLSDKWFEVPHFGCTVLSCAFAHLVNNHLLFCLDAYCVEFNVLLTIAERGL